MNEYRMVITTEDTEIDNPIAFDEWVKENRQNCGNFYNDDLYILYRNSLRGCRDSLYGWHSAESFIKDVLINFEEKTVTDDEVDAWIDKTYGAIEIADEVFDSSEVYKKLLNPHGYELERAAYIEKRISELVEALNADVSNDFFWEKTERGTYRYYLTEDIHCKITFYIECRPYQA